MFRGKSVSQSQGEDRKTGNPSFTVSLRAIHFVVAFIHLVIITTAGICLYRDMLDDAGKEAGEKADILINQAIAVRKYFSNELRPAIFNLLEEHDIDAPFDTRWMSSSYAVRKIFANFTEEGYEDYYIKSVAMDARNPINEADLVEKAFLEELEKDASLKKRFATRVIGGVPYYEALKRNIAFSPSCMRCHDEPEKAPAGLVEQYGKERGFHREVGKSVSALSIRIPMERAYETSARHFWRLSGTLLTLIILLLGVQYLILRKIFFTPLQDIRKKAVQIADDNVSLGESIPFGPSVELNSVVGALNDMSMSLRRSRDTLEETVAQRTQELHRANEQLLTEIFDRRDAEEALKKALADADSLTRALEQASEEKERKNEELEKALRHLKESQSTILQQEKLASIGQLAAGIAHEINNPIGFIASNLGTMKKYVDRLQTYMKKLSEAVHDPHPYLFDELADMRKNLKIDFIVADMADLSRESLEGTERVRGIIQDLKNFARKDSGETNMADINGCLDSTVNIVWNELKYKAELVRRYGDLPLVLCNQQQLNQVFMNILVNAGQAIGEKGTITVRTWCEAENIYVSISDNGCGIPAENINRLYEPFFTTKEVGKGTGLGLSIAYDIMRKHDGDIMGESEVGKGSTFTVRIPVR